MIGGNFETICNFVNFGLLSYLLNYLYVDLFGQQLYIQSDHY